MTARKPARPAEGGAHELGDRSSLWGPRCRDPAAPVFGLDVLHGEFGRQLLCFDQPMRFAASRARRRRLRLCCHHGRRSRSGHAQLSVTEPGKPPTLGSFRPEGRAATMVTGVVALYLLAWIATGLAALVVGVMLYPKVNQTLADIGTTWLGLAVSAAYAYFGLPRSRPNPRPGPKPGPRPRSKPDPKPFRFF